MITNTPAIYYEGEARRDVSNVIQQEIVNDFDTSDLDTTTDNQKLVEKVNILNNIYSNDKLCRPMLFQINPVLIFIPVKIIQPTPLLIFTK